jgi:hypothetical protein
MLKFEDKGGRVVIEMNDQGDITKQTLPLKEEVKDNKEKNGDGE